MAGRVFRRSTPAENLRVVLHAIPWRLLLLIPVLLIISFPVFLLGTGAGQRLLPALTTYFYNMGNSPSPVATPYPAFPAVLPQPGSLLYTVQAGDNCDEILSTQVHMADANPGIDGGQAQGFFLDLDGLGHGGNPWGNLWLAGRAFDTHM